MGDRILAALWHISDTNSLSSLLTVQRLSFSIIKFLFNRKKQHLQHELVQSNTCRLGLLHSDPQLLAVSLREVLAAAVGATAPQAPAAGAGTL